MTVGVLLMAYGTPASPDDIEAYYTHIRRGRPPSAEQLADLRRRYDAIGGLSPLRAVTERQVAAIAAALGDGYRVALGYKHAAPFLEDALADLADCDVVVAAVLAPHYSALSVGEYHERARAAAASAGVPIRTVDSWHRHPAYLDALAARVTEALSHLPGGSRVRFTAHSLPARILDMGDRYPDDLRATAHAVAARVHLTDHRWDTAWQSAGRTPEPWLGPDVLDVVRAEAANGAPGLVVCPCGFVADHLEVLYDLDVDAARLAAEVGLPFSRTASLNDDPGLVAAVADSVRQAAGGDDDGDGDGT